MELWLWRLCFAVVRWLQNGATQFLRQVGPISRIGKPSLQIGGRELKAVSLGESDVAR